eukprot:GILK01000693.1.p1 GENE.GILK01000693.1~~GILK01000693.1.p1  ORF type:complete len:150 (+),score=24.93 GILK01000693.1:40-450(+)
MASGIGAADSCVEKYNELKLRHNARYIIYKIEEGREIQIEHIGERAATYDQFLSLLPENDCRYAVFDYEFNTTDGRPQSKLVFFAWSPDTSSVKTKMTYSASKQKFKAMLVGLAKEVQATDPSDVDAQTVESALKK